MHACRSIQKFTPDRGFKVRTSDSWCLRGVKGGRRNAPARALRMRLFRHERAPPAKSEDGGTAHASGGASTTPPAITHNVARARGPAHERHFCDVAPASCGAGRGGRLRRWHIRRLRGAEAGRTLHEVALGCWGQGGGSALLWRLTQVRHNRPEVRTHIHTYQTRQDKTTICAATRRYDTVITTP